MLRCATEMHSESRTGGSSMYIPGIYKLLTNKPSFQHTRHTQPTCFHVSATSSNCLSCCMNMAAAIPPSCKAELVVAKELLDHSCSYRSPPCCSACPSAAEKADLCSS